MAPFMQTCSSVIREYMNRFYSLCDNHRTSCHNPNAECSLQC
uniref:Uncharacterized protein n=1 Tax=Anguilla anguilla TaxID=7936 RepID=A0A0E9PS96_ANGAN